MGFLSGLKKVKRYMKLPDGYKLLSIWTSSQSVEMDDGSTLESNKPNWDDKYTRSEVDNKLSAIETNIDWKESVDTFADISTAYPDPQDGWTVNVKDTDYTYRYSGEEWVVISANAIPKATQSIDGLLTKEDKTSYDSAVEKKHEHDNKSALDMITSEKIAGWDELSQNSVTGVKGNKEETYRTGNVNIKKEDIGLENVDNTADSDKPVSTAMQTALDLFYANANQFTLNKIAELINGAPATMDTLKEIADAMATHQTVVNALDAAIGQKANQAELDTHTNNNTIHLAAIEKQQLGSMIQQFSTKANAIAPLKCYTLPSDLTSKMSINNLGYDSSQGYYGLGRVFSDNLNSQYIYIEGGVYKVYRSGYYHLYMRCYMTACSHPASVKRMQMKVGNDYKIYNMQRASTYEMMCDSTIAYCPVGGTIDPIFQMDYYGSTVTTATLSALVEITPIFVN